MQIVTKKNKNQNNKLRGLRINALRQITILIIVLSPLLNTLNKDLAIYKYSFYLIAFVCSCFCFTSYNRLFFVALSSFSFGILIFFDLGTALALAVGIICALAIYSTKQEFSHVILIITYFQFALSIAQLFGLNEYVYLFSDQQNPPSTYQQWSSYQNVTTTFLPQIRPSGFFPAPTYSSLFLCAVLLAIFIKKDLSLLSSIIIGLLIAVSGSTFSLLVFVVCLILFNSLRWGKALILSYFLGMLLYHVSLSDVFFYNFNIYEFINSVSARFWPEDNLSESVFFQSISGSILVICFLIVLIYFLFKGKKFNTYIILPATVILFPVLVHNVASSLVYFFLAALSIIVAYDTYKKNKRPSNKYTLF